LLACRPTARQSAVIQSCRSLPKAVRRARRDGDRDMFHPLNVRHFTYRL
jgi:hypothetical protein